MEYVVSTFRNNDFGEIRMIEEDGRILFCGIDVAYALGYTKPRNALQTHCKGALKRGALTAGGTQSLTFIPEGDVYRLITKSRLEKAQDFERWVFDEVLPSIRKNGGYMTNHLLEESRKNPEVLLEFAQRLLEENNRNKELQLQIEALQPKASYYDHFMEQGDCTNIRTTAKELKIPERRFVKCLLEGSFLYRSPSGTLLPYATQKNKTLFIVKDFNVNGHMCSQTLITPKGKELFQTIFDDQKE
ncbi:MAG: BRO family protein [Eubacteriales bacterium]|nr:BRO family protein [Eubacteriales bacterium]